MNRNQRGGHVPDGPVNSCHRSPIVGSDKPGEGLRRQCRVKPPMDEGGGAILPVRHAGRLPKSARKPQGDPQCDQHSDRHAAIVVNLVLEQVRCRWRQQGAVRARDRRRGPPLGDDHQNDRPMQDNLDVGISAHLFLHQAIIASRTFEIYELSDLLDRAGCSSRTGERKKCARKCRRAPRPVVLRAATVVVAHGG